MDNESLKKVIQDYVNEHPEQFEKIALDIDALLDETMKEYDASIEKIKQSIIHDPKPITDPVEEMRKQVGELKEKLVGEIKKKLDTYTEQFAQTIQS